MFDKDGSGTISSSELKKLCQELGLKVTDSEVTNLVRLMDKDGSGAIDFEEFANVMSAQLNKQPSEEELREAFDYFDKDRSGMISEDELFEAMIRFKAGLTKQQVHSMVNAIDKNHDGSVSFKGIKFFFLFYLYLCQ